MYTNANFKQAKKEIMQHAKRWTDISGEMRIFKKEMEGYHFYSTSISRKNEEGKWVNVYLNVKGKPLDELEFPKNGLLVDVEGFLSLDLYQDKNEPYIVVTAINMT